MHCKAVEQEGEEEAEEEKEEEEEEELASLSAFSWKPEAFTPLHSTSLHSSLHP